MIHRLLPVLAFALALTARATLAPSAQEARPLPVGQALPAATLTTAAGEATTLARLTADRPTVLIFYRGSWCPYCNRHLAALAEIEPQLLEKGFRILAISPDTPEGLKKMADKNHLNYQLVSDSAMEASSALGLAFRVDEKTQAAYLGHGIALATVPGEPDARWLPVPAVFIVDRKGIIKFAHTDPDYKTRLSASDVLAAAASVN